MNVSNLSEFLLWCLVVNYVILLWWFAIFIYAHDWLYRLHSRWFHISPKHFDAIHYACMAIYKVAILAFNLVPYIALRILVSHGG